MVKVWSVEDAHEAAIAVPGFLAFFAIAGGEIRDGRSRAVFDAFAAVMPAKAAWRAIESWDGMLACESQTGWSPELATAAVVMSSNESWREVDWLELASRVAKKPTLR